MTEFRSHACRLRFASARLVRSIHTAAGRPASSKTTRKNSRRSVLPPNRIFMVMLRAAAMAFCVSRHTMEAWHGALVNVFIIPQSAYASANQPNDGGDGQVPENGRQATAFVPLVSRRGRARRTSQCIVRCESGRVSIVIAAVWHNNQEVRLCE